MFLEFIAHLTLAAKRKATFALSQGFSFRAITSWITIARGLFKFFVIVKKHENNQREITWSVQQENKPVMRVRSFPKIDRSDAKNKKIKASDNFDQWEEEDDEHP